MFSRPKPENVPGRYTCAEPEESIVRMFHTLWQALCAVAHCRRARSEWVGLWLAAGLPKRVSWGCRKAQRHPGAPQGPAHQHLLLLAPMPPPLPPPTPQTLPLPSLRAHSQSHAEMARRGKGGPARDADSRRPARVWSGSAVGHASHPPQFVGALAQPPRRRPAQNRDWHLRWVLRLRWHAGQY